MFRQDSGILCSMPHTDCTRLVPADSFIDAIILVDSCVINNFNPIYHEKSHIPSTFLIAIQGMCHFPMDDLIIAD